MSWRRGPDNTCSRSEFQHRAALRRVQTRGSTCFDIRGGCAWVYGLHDESEKHRFVQIISDAVARKLATTQEELPPLPELKPLSQRPFSKEAEQVKRDHRRVGRLIATRYRKLKVNGEKRTEALGTVGRPFGYSPFEAEILIKHWSRAVWNRVERMRGVLVRNWLVLHWTPTEIAARLNVSVQHARRIITEISQLDFENEDLAEA